MNYVMICLDSLRQDRMDAYAAEDCRTPNLDRFAGRAAVFTRARSASLQPADDSECRLLVADSW